jgi:opacity protein-like surface antigen
MVEMTAAVAAAAVAAVFAAAAVAAVKVAAGYNFSVRTSSVASWWNNTGNIDGNESDANIHGMLIQEDKPIKGPTRAKWASQDVLRTLPVAACDQPSSPVTPRR